MNGAKRRIAFRPRAEGRAPLPYETHQVIRMYGVEAPALLAEMQLFCDEYGVTPSDEAGR